MNTATDPIDDVDVFIGTSATGHTTPAAAYPLGLVQPGPDTGNEDWAYCSGYRFDDDRTYGFSQTHLNGTGCQGLGDIRLFPFTGEWTGGEFQAGMDKATEKASPGEYSVTLDNGIAAAMTCSRHVAFHRYRWPAGATDRRLLLDFQWGLVFPGMIDNHILSSDIWRTFDGFSGTVSSWNWTKRDVHFAIAFDTPVADVETLPPRAPLERAPRYVVRFAPGEAPVQIKVALSTSTPCRARRNMEKEVPHWDWTKTRDEARDAWRGYLSRMDVEGATPRERRIFRTCLYHLFWQPNDIADAGEKPFYSTFSLWDTFRAAHPLYTVIAPELVNDFVNSFLRHNADFGYLPVWPLWKYDEQSMIGNHAVPVAVDAWLKGFRGFDVNALMDAVNDTLRRYHPGPKGRGKLREAWNELDKYGYLPFDLCGRETASRTLEGSYDDWCAHLLAKSLGRDDDAAFFLKRSQAWRNVFDPETGFMRAKDSQGRFREPFDPFQVKAWGDKTADYVEGNAWQSSWHVLQDPEGLVAAHGGREKFGERLKGLFDAPETDYSSSGYQDITGTIGQYAHGNEPSHHAIYLFPYAGRGDLAARYVREVFDRFYIDGPEGVCGNEDCGQISAWYLFSAAGFYPFNPCGGDYVIGAPQFPRLTFNLPEGRTFTVVANGISRENKYVKSVALNGRPLDGFIVRHADIMAGGELVFEMAPCP
jgi:predicted alpha-1,2-mannosidase